MMTIIKLRNCLPTVLRLFVASSSVKCDVISSGCVSGELAAKRLDLRRFVTSASAKRDVISSGCVSGELAAVDVCFNDTMSSGRVFGGVSGELAAKRLSLRRFVTSSPAKCDVISSDCVSGGVSGDLAVTRLNLRRFVTSSSAKCDVISSGGVSGDLATRRLNLRRFVTSSPAKCDVISSGELAAKRTIFRGFIASSLAKCDVISSDCVSGELAAISDCVSGELAARRLNLRRFVTSSSEKSDVMSSGRVSGELAAEDVCFNDEAAASTAVKSSVLPTLLQPRVVIYDGVCHLCHRGVKLVINADKHKKIKFCCLQSKAAEPYLRICGVDREDVLRRFLFIEGPYEYHQGSTAALKVLSYLPLPYSALSTLMIIPTPIRDLAYDYIAKKRYDWFGKDTNCLVLKEKELLERFIDRDEMVQKEWSDE